MPQMSDDERDTFLAEQRIGVLAIGRENKAALLAPIWYQYEPAAGAIEIAMAGSSVKARRLRAEGRASVCVQHEGLPYRYVTAEGPVSLRVLDGTDRHEQMLAMATRYLGEKAGKQYADGFHDDEEVMVTLTVENWRTEVLG